MDDADEKGSDATAETTSRDHDIEALRATQEEARTVLDHQLQTFNDVDHKAALTSRINVLLLGVLFTAGSFFAQAEAFDAAPYFNYATGLGAVLLIGSFALAIATYTTTNVETGIGPTDILRLVDVEYTEEQWLLLLLRSEAKWIRENERRQSFNGALLTTSHLTLIAAIASLTVGIAIVQW